MRPAGPRESLILTYDLSGLDGHADHVACAEMLTELHEAEWHHVSLWYVALPARVRRLLQLAHQLSTYTELERRRALPTARIFVGIGVIPKIRAWYAYRSQRRQITHGLGKLIPSWLGISMLQFEYFAEVS